MRISDWSSDVCSSDLIDQLNELKSGRTANRRTDVARLHRRYDVGEQVGDFILVAPVQIATLQGIGRIGVADGGGGEVHLALVDQILAALVLDRQLTSLKSSP